MNIRQLALAALLFVPAAAEAASTYIDGEFDGCTEGKTYRLENGQTLVCDEFRSGYGYRPRVTIESGRITGIGGKPFRATAGMNARSNGEFNIDRSQGRGGVSQGGAFIVTPGRGPVVVPGSSSLLDDDDEPRARASQPEWPDRNRRLDFW